ncbi:hypothetical protein [Geobacter anodireducens]|uniref:hypothetical protein n=1 Tax=Geobacter anodireducens TaxID=1340425 RepID=UPI001CF50BFF|nr:hypothetical protein [Geobacter anodireducens]
MILVLRRRIKLRTWLRQVFHPELHGVIVSGSINFHPRKMRCNPVKTDKTGAVEKIVYGYVLMAAAGVVEWTLYRSADDYMKAAK